MPVTTPGGVRTTTASLPLRAVVAAAAGVGLALAFPPADLLHGWLAVPALALLVAAFRGLTWRQGAVVGLAGGYAFFLALLGWLRVIGLDAWAVLSLLQATFWVGMGAVLPALLRRRWWVWTVPALWVCVEALRGRIPWGGFPWGRLAFAQADTALVGWAAIGGAALVSFAVALSATALLAGVDALRRGRWRSVAGWIGGIVAVALGGGAVATLDRGGPDGAAQPIAIVQGNVPRLGLDFNAQRRAVLDGHVEATERLAAEVAAGTVPQPVAVIWPENSSDIDPLTYADAAAQVSRAARAIGAPILVGAIKVNPDDPPSAGHQGTILNVGLVWDPVTGPGQAYVKRHPVPFGEYLPLRGILTRFISRFERIPRDFVGGTQPGLLQIGPVPAGVVICFEISYDELVRDAIRAGGQVLVVQTNNATYGHTGLPEQQLAITQVQAVASGRTTLVAATSGISAVIEPDGSLAWSTEEFTQASTVAQVPMRSGLTPAMRIGPLTDWAALALLVALLALGRRRTTPVNEGSAGDGVVEPDPRGTMAG